MDTNVVSEVFRPQPDARVVSWLESLTGDVAITAITLAELLAGLRRLPEGRRKSTMTMTIETALQPYKGTWSVLAFDAAAADHYAAVFAGREEVGLPISMADAQIAAICRVHAATYATRNTKDFAGAGVELINRWTVHSHAS
ncbi:type II toxin-antitoxin system VapC family toxin [Arthrobacter sp. Soil782]|uniref:type II toxin-antitoxin system VapC family toxin n=1 Tax=Arthrobacter sp. Soil782 TaxID=1736410 RepID=UPI001F3CA1DC|nr:type II toxin-antitoxin system VapC family toxin [Arthrobacter sp. Soil782]